MTLNEDMINVLKERSMSVNPDIDFDQEVVYTFNREKYSVRNNGAVLRHPKVEGKVRANDNYWTFGKPNDRTGYLEIASVRVHRLVAMAFHGEPPSKEHIVDHIDTNRRNNRPDNLRWITRLENVLLNPITARRIAIVCGSVEEFLADPSKYRDKFQEPNYSWMCTVSAEEAQATLTRFRAWAKSDRKPSGGKLGDWIMSRNEEFPLPEPDIKDFNDSLTLNAVQRNWNIPSEFPCCPQEFNDEPIKSYSENLKPGSIFCTNESYTSQVIKSVVLNDSQTIIVLSESSEVDNPEHADPPSTRIFAQ